MAQTQVVTPEDNLIKSADLVRAREVEFTFMFTQNLRKLMEALNITRKIQKQAGTNLKAYKAVGTLEDGNVEEGKIIPLSKYKTEPVTFDEITLKKDARPAPAASVFRSCFVKLVPSVPVVCALPAYRYAPAKATLTPEILICITSFLSHNRQRLSAI